MSSRYSIFAVLTSAVLLLAAPAGAMTLKEAVEKAIAESPRVIGAQASRRATDRVLQQAWRRYLPEIDLSADAGHEIIDKPNAFGPDDNKKWRKRARVSVNVRQILFDGFERANDIFDSKARISAAAYKVLARSEIVALNVIEAYIDVIRHDRLIRLARESVERHRELLKNVQARVEGGKNSEGDLNQTRERLQASLALQSQIKSARDIAEAKFKSAVGVGPRRLHSVKFPGNPYRSSADAVDAAVLSNSRLAALQHEIDSAGFKSDRSRSSLFPTVTLEGSATRGQDLDGTDGKANEARGMIVLRWKLFDGGVRRQRIEELKEREFVKIAEYDTSVRQIREEIEIAWSKLFEGLNQVRAKRRQLAETEKVVASYRAEYEADKRSLLDVLDAENTRFAIEFDLSNTSSIRQFAGYELLGHTGDLLEYLGVARPEGAAVEKPDTSSDSYGLTSGKSVFKSFVIPPLK
jgi:adhesin transport system outer membrane protein